MSTNALSNMNVLVTGASGFLGSHVAEQLIEQGHHVRALVRKSSNRTFLSSLEGIEWAEGSVEHSDSLEKAVQGVHAIVHCAGLVKVRTPSEFFAVNVQGTENLLQAACTHAKGIKRFVLVSSLEAAGPSPDGQPVSVNDPPQPVTHYGRSKLEAEQVARSMKEALPITIVRPTAIYGPRDMEMFAVFQNVARGLLPMIGDGKNKVTMVYATDAAHACIKAIEADVPSASTYFIDDGMIYVWREALAEIEQAVGRRAWMRWGIPFRLFQGIAIGSEIAGKLMNRPVMLNRDKLNGLRRPYWVCSSEQTRKDLNWMPKVSWKEGTHLTARWYQEHGWL